MYLEIGVDWDKLSQREISPETIRNSLLVYTGSRGFYLTDEIDGYEQESFLSESARIPFLVHHGHLEDKDKNVRFSETQILDLLYGPL